jgi:hypothetical protein
LVECLWTGPISEKEKEKKEREGDKERKKNGKEKNMYGALESGGSWRSLKKKGWPIWIKCVIGKKVSEGCHTWTML